MTSKQRRRSPPRSSASTNDERPYQSLSCANLLPRVAFPTLPTLPAVPTFVDADRWLYAYDGHSFVRKVRHGGDVSIAERPYYVKTTLVGQQVAVRVDAAVGQFVVQADGREAQHLAIKGIGLGVLSFATFLEHLCADPDAHFTVLTTITADEQVVTRWTTTATHQGSFAGVAPTQQPVTM